MYPKGLAAEGTRCSLDKKIKDVCIQGQCRVSNIPLTKFGFVSSLQHYEPDGGGAVVVVTALDFRSEVRLFKVVSAPHRVV